VKAIEAVERTAGRAALITAPLEVAKSAPDE
jgi:hypothetical protein